jgi:hypothetical protein
LAGRLPVPRQPAIAEDPHPPGRPGCTLTSEDGERRGGGAVVLADLDRIAILLAASNAKCRVDHQIDFLDPSVNATVRVAPVRAFALNEKDFTGSPTRWHFHPQGYG